MLFMIERAAAPLLDMTTYGTQRTLFTRSALGEQPKIWTQKRPRGAKFYPGLLDNTALEVVPVDKEPLEAARGCSRPLEAARGCYQVCC